MGSTTGVNEIVNDVNQNKEPKLNTKAKEITYNMGNRHHQAWKIDLAKDVGVFNKCIGRLGNAIGEILPQTGTGQIKQRPRYTITTQVQESSAYTA